MNMQTHELVPFLRGLATTFLYAPDFDTEGCFSILTGVDEKPYIFISFYARDKFVAAVKALGSSTKEYTTGDYPRLQVTARDFPIKLSISRDTVCRKTEIGRAHV